MKTIELCIRQCSRHGYTCADIGEQDSSSLRITGSKCCGSWDKLLHRFKLDAYDLDAAATEFRKLSRRLKREKAALSRNAA